MPVRSQNVIGVSPRASKDSSTHWALIVSNGKYKVMFLSFPFEVLDTPTDRANLMTAELTWLNKMSFVSLPVTLRN